jgi:Carboxypeptidase regulatory-like domain
VEEGSGDEVPGSSEEEEAMDWLRRSWNGRAQQRSASVLLVCSMLLFTARAAAQESRATITGRVIDSSGGVLPGVTVTVINLETNSPATAITNENGQYTILYVTPSTYRVSAELRGFKKALLDRVEFASAIARSSISRSRPGASPRRCR